MMQIFVSKGAGRIGRFSLSLRVSLLLTLAALAPLIVTIFSSELLSRPQLIAQANSTMEADTQTHIQSIANFFSQPIIDVSLISQNTALSNFLSGDTTDDARLAATQVLTTGFQRSIDYISWSLIDKQNTQSLLSYPLGSARPHGNYFIPPAILQQLTTPNKAVVSSAFFDPAGAQLTTDVTEPIFSNNGKVIGFLRATLNINFIWSIVLGERGQNGTGSYAFIVDQNGVIIAHSDITQNFTAVAPFTASELKDMNMVDRYGKNAIPPVLNYSSLASAQAAEENGQRQEVALDMVPPGHNDSFQVIGKLVPIVSWTYYVLSPTKVVTSLADQELFNIGISGLAVLLLSAITGLIVGRRITAPVLRSVERLQASSQSLKDLADREQMTITEQGWIVDSSRVGLSSVDYYIDATRTATLSMLHVGAELKHHWPYVNQAKIENGLNQMTMAASYIEKAVEHQKKDSKKLSATIDLTKQITDQLTSSAASATSAAEQMEQVVSELEHVVGKK